MRKALFLCLLAGLALNACTKADKVPAPVVSSSALTTAPTSLNTGTSYYVSNAGADTNTGTEAAPFKTLDRVNQLTLSHGDRIYLAAGQTFAGTLTLTGNANTQPGDPVYVATYGTDTTKAVIQPNPGSLNAIKISDFTGIDIRNLELEGSGSGGIGVEVVATANAATAIANTRFGGARIYQGGNYPTRSGYQGLRRRRSNALPNSRLRREWHFYVRGPVAGHAQQKPAD
jgi:hypothetical protein